MTSVSSTRPSQSPRPAPREPQARPAAADDLKALGEAFSKANEKLDRFAARQAKTALPHQQREEAAAQATTVKPRSDDRDSNRRPVAADRGSEAQGGTAQALAAAPPPPPIAMPNFPAAHVDPSGFAQMLADLWTRENGKGAKEVRVRFGENAWPTTGAHLVRNAAGTLDIEVQVASATNASRANPDLSGLDRHLRDAGLGVGSLAFSEDALAG